ncbi:gluconokinase [Phyllobacterium leguminum]|uniref:Gluconokinase n=1 Tax=Phyllobacterium leguminum TaxID=314237 RepID=A0A318T504_9HYPH|nr:gluconokinase [Phyllobacterium leguminum]PYE90050.1 gluconate kinase (SKI family) [Phyllobacterium leguminum]
MSKEAALTRRPEFVPGFVPDFVLVMGVCGVGKSTVGRAIAERSGGSFIEADEFHPEANIRLMSAGQPLSDADRWPWLGAIAEGASEALKRDGAPVIIACSALKQSYRDFLREKLGSIAILHLTGPRDLILQRMTGRSHFMPPELLDSQLAALEELAPAEKGITMTIDQDPAKLVEWTCALLGMPDAEVESRKGETA